MNPNLRKTYIKEIERSLETLGSQSLADIGQILLEAQTGLKIEKRGQSISGEPVGWIVDVNSNGFTVTGEFSADQDYFEDNRNKKIKKDIKHSFLKAPDAEKYFFLSNRKCGPKKYADLTNRLNACGTKRNKKLYIQDSVWISTYIVDELIEKQDFQNIKRLGEIIEPIERIKNEHILTNTLPEVKSEYLVRSEDEKEIFDKLSTNMYVLLHGISGIGKTFLAISIANKFLNDNPEFAPIWIDGKTITTPESLYSLKIDRYGISQNIIGLMQRFKTLVIIDNLDIQAAEIINLIKEKVLKDFALIITSQIAAKTVSEHHVDFLNEDLSRKLLNRNTASNCPEDLFKVIYQFIGGHAFLLDQVNILVNSDSTWKGIEKEIEHLPASENNAQAFFDRLFTNHIKALNKELACLKWVDAKTIERELLIELIGATGIEKIKKRSFFNTVNKTTVTLHDIVFKSLQFTNISFDLPLFEKDFAKSLEEWFLKYNPNYYRVIHSHKDLVIRNLSSKKQLGIFSYAYLQATPLHAFDITILPQFDIKVIRDLFQYYSDDKYFVLLSWIEYIELNYRIIKEREGPEPASDSLSPYITELQILISSNHQLPKNVVLDVKNHLGKFYRNKGLQKEAINEFNQILQEDNKFWAAKFHLAKIFRQTNKPLAESYIREILSAYGKESDITSTIVLAAFKEIRSFNSLDNEFLTVFIDSFYSLINETFVSHFDLPYEVLGALSSRIGFQFPEKLIYLTDKLPIPSENSIDYKTLFDIGQTYSKTGEAYLNLEKPDIAKSYFRQAEAYYNKFNKPSDFQKRLLAENYLLLEEIDMAKAILLEVEEKKREAFWRYTYAKTLRLQVDFANALIIINEVIDDEDLNEKYISTMYRERALIKKEMGDASFKDDYENALNACRDDTFRKRIICEMDKWR